MANQTPCLTPGAYFHCVVQEHRVGVVVELPFTLNVTEREAYDLENHMHNAMEMALAHLFAQKGLT